MRVFLIGFMGSGKTTQGKRLAKRLAVPFVDLDQEVETEAGQPIPRIFKKKGEAAFRRLEQEALHRVMARKHFVCATGGGAPLYFDNLARMQEAGLTVYFELPASVLFQRLEHARQHRPLLANQSGPALYQYIKDKLAERAPTYEQAALRVDTRKLAAAELDQVVAELRARWQAR